MFQIYSIPYFYAIAEVLILLRQALAEQLILNRLDASHLSLTPGHALADLSLVELLVHFKVVLSAVHKNSLHGPLVTMMLEPQSLAVRILYC